MYKYIETQRLIIEPLTRNDSSFILELVNSKDWLQYIGDRNVKDEESAQKYIQSILQNKNYYCNVFKLKEIKQAIGIITFIYRETQTFPDIGFALLPEYEKKGYAYEAAKKYLDEIIIQQKNSKVIAITLPDNSNSVKLLEKLGLKLERNFIENNEQLSLYSL